MEKTDLLTILRTEPDFILVELSHSPEWQGMFMRSYLVICFDKSEIITPSCDHVISTIYLKIIQMKMLIIVSFLCIHYSKLLK
jgi:hypothetical protein